MPVTDLQDPRLDPYRRISDAELLRTHGQFIAEGRFVVERVLADPALTVLSLLLNRASFEALGPLLDDGRRTGPVYCVETPAFASITGFNLHRGCLALVSRPRRPSWPELVARGRMFVLLEGISNADNVGSVFRNAAAFGADGVLLSPGTCDPFYRKAVRTSMGAVLRVPHAVVEPWPDALQALRDSGLTLVALTPRAPSMDLDGLAADPRPARMALLVGTEGAGLSTAAELAADIRVRIRIRDTVDSLNLSVATGIALSRLSSWP
ncbi:MAG: TrmH family RNA methyltransferase [Vicinamibacterales bacterium]